ncbi:signal peptidase I [Nocardioides alcanivorans]|uniref:signal peptidase I n=1 Tax=Nocardioides alcanivorans TaxID=2897352 RepID=UPI001F42DF8A|nr:signal peptidase I [Nocardioides alcanivorans]
MSARRALREVALTSGAVLGVLCAIVALASPLLGAHLLVFKSGSMGPDMDTGALAVSHTVDASEVAVGDVVSVVDSDGRRITHRVTDVTADGNQVLLTLQGDANAQPDSEPYPVTEVDRVVWHVNQWGHVVDALSSPYAVFIAGAGAAGLLVLTFRRRSSGGADTRTTRTATVTDKKPVAAGIALGSVALALLTAGTALGGSTVNSTLAAFSDTATVTAPASALTVPAPASIDCTNGEIFSGRVYLGWPAVTGTPAGYRYLLVSYSTDPSDPISTHVVDTPPNGNGKVVTTLPRSDFPGPGDYRVTVLGSLDGTDWSSSTGSTLTVRAGQLGHEISC